MNLRGDRLVTLYLVNPIRQGMPLTKSAIPILMYHSIANEYETGIHPYYRTITTPSTFALHMKHLSDRGYSTINLAEALRLLHDGSSERKCAVITFDDGYSDFYRYAFPTLSRYQFSATVFLPTAFIGTQAVQFKGRDCLTWSEIRELRNHGVSFGSHTVTHPQLSTLDAKAVKTEIVNSKRMIEDNLGECVEAFAYPYAFPEEKVAFVQLLRDTLAASGYHHGVSTRIGRARPQEDCYFLRRLPMNSLDDIALLDAKLQGGYDWVSKLQYASKFIRAKVT